MDWPIMIVVVLMAGIIAVQYYEKKCKEDHNTILRDMLKLQKECYKAQEAVLVSTESLVKIKEERIQNCENLLKKYSESLESCKRLISIMDKKEESESRLAHAKKLFENQKAPGQKLMAEKLDEALSNADSVVVIAEKG